MKITEVRLGLISVPLRVPFKTALRSGPIVINCEERVSPAYKTQSALISYLLSLTSNIYFASQAWSSVAYFEARVRENERSSIP